jgi:hypothetical protein
VSSIFPLFFLAGLFVFKFYKENGEDREGGGDWEVFVFFFSRWPLCLIFYKENGESGEGNNLEETSFHFSLCFA